MGSGLQSATPALGRSAATPSRTAADAHPTTRAILGRVEGQLAAAAGALGVGAGGPPYARIRVSEVARAGDGEGGGER